MSRPPVADLLQQVLAEHEREVAELKREIRRLTEQHPRQDSTTSASGSTRPPTSAAGTTGDPQSEQEPPCCEDAGSPSGGGEAEPFEELREEQPSARHLQEADRALRPEPRMLREKLVAPSGDGIEPAGADEFSAVVPASEVATEQSAPSKGYSSQPSLTKRESFIGDDQEGVSPGWLRKLIDGPLDKVGSVVIVLNIMFLVLQLQYDGYVVGVEEGFTSAGQWPHMDLTLKVIEHAFNCVFALELIIRIAVLRGTYFCSRSGGLDRFNIFDFVLVLAASIDLWIVQPVANSDGMKISLFRPLRCIRLLRALRVLQGIKIFIALRVLVMTIAASFLALFWSILLLVIIMLMAALFLCQLLSSSVEDPMISEDRRQWIYTMYGTSFRSFYTVFEFTFSGGWPNYARPLVEDVNSLFAVFFFVYIVAVVFAIFRIISALFLRDTLALAAADAELAIQDKMIQKEAYAAKLLDFFKAADSSGDGFLSHQEFDDMLQDHKVKTWFSIMEVDVHETEEFFELLADDKGLVSAEDFVRSIPRLKGQARAQDVIAIRFKSQQITSSLDDVRKVVGSLTDAVADVSQQLRAYQI